MHSQFRDASRHGDVSHWGPPEGWTIPDVLRRQVEQNPERTFLQTDDQSYTFAQIWQRAQQRARRMAALGVGPGDRVLVMASNGIGAIDTWLGLAVSGAIDVSLNTAYRGNSLVHGVNLSRSRLLVVEAEYLDRVREVESELEHLTDVLVLGEQSSVEFSRLVVHDVAGPEVDVPSAPVSWRDEAAVIYTSGTTGPAKGVRMSQAQCFAIGQQSVDALRMTEDDVFYCFHPMFHMAGKFGAVLAAMITGCRVVLDRAFDPDSWLDRVREIGATVSIAHGPMIEMIHARPALANDGDNPLRALVCAPVPAAIGADFERRFGLRGVETWGMTEVTCISWMDLHEPLRPGSAGRPLQGLADVRVVDPETDVELPANTVGEIVVRPKVPWIVSMGYLHMPEKTLEAWRNLWFHSGDAGFFDEDGYLHMVDRLGDRIRRRAENISSYEIEVAASGFPGIRESAAVAVPSPYAGDDDIKLVVGADAPVDFAALFAHLVRHLPHHMVPRYYEQIDSLPRTPTNKVQKAKLRAGHGASGSWDYKDHGLSIRDQSQNMEGARDGG